MDVFTISGCTMCSITCFQVFMLFRSQRMLRSLFDRCTVFHQARVTSKGRKQTFEQVNGTIAKPIALMHGLSYANPIFLTGASLVVTLILKRVHFALPMYRTADWMTKPHWAVLLSCLLIMTIFYFNRVMVFTFSLFTIFVHEIAGEYKCLGLAINDLSLLAEEESDDKQVSEQLNGIGARHSNLLTMLSDLNDLFSTSLLASELFSIVGIPLCGFSFLFRDSSVTAGVGAAFTVLFKILYSLVGQHIITSANQFEAALYECNWIEFSPWNRKQLALMMLLAQKPVGLRSGGFHYVDHAQLMSVSRLIRFWG